MCQGRKLRRVVCKSCSSAGRYEVLGLWEISKKGYKCKGGRNSCVIWDFKDEIESRHRCATCLAKAMLGFSGGHHSTTSKNPSGGYNATTTGHQREDRQMYAGPSSSTSAAVEGWYGNNEGSSSRLRYSSDASFA